MEKYQTQKKSKNQCKKLFLTRGIVFIMLFIMALPMLCSFTYPITISITNPNNYGYSGTIVLNDDVVSFGDHVINASTSSIVTVDDGNLILDGYSFSFAEGATILDGSYSVDFTVSSDVVDSFAILPKSLPLDATFGVVSAGANDIAFFVGDIDDFVVASLGDVSSLLLDVVVLSPISPSYSEPITNVWTGLSEWFVGALGSVQGLFYTDGFTSLNQYLDMSNTIEYDGQTFAELGSAAPDDGELVFNGIIIDESLDPDVIDIDIDGVGYTGVSIDGIIFEMFNGDGVYFNTGYPNSLGFISGDFGLTFLGTLAVIGVSISIAFLIIMVIQRFLRLRS